VVFALVAGAAFAADVGATVMGTIIPLKGDSVEDSKAEAGGLFGRIRFEASGQNEDGTFGGWLRMEAPNNWSGDGLSGGTTYGEGVVAAGGFVWWKPVDIFKLQIGSNPDGHFGADGNARWGFYQVAADVRIVMEDWATQAFYGGFGAPGAILTLTPIEALSINVGVPFLTTGWGEPAEDLYKKTVAQIAYDIGGIGKLAVTFTGDLGDHVGYDTTKWTVSGNGSSLYAYFGLSAIENLGVDIGLKFTLPVTEDDYTYNAPLAVGLAVKFDAGAFGIKARVDAQLGETASAKGASDDWKGNTVIIADVLPYFAVSDKLSAFLSAGLKITSPADNESLTGEKPGDAVVGWHINPYIAVKANWWAPNFYAGLRIESDGVKGADDKTVTKWSVPIGIIFDF